ncbi:hypothetical protein [Streptomyces natalensis]|uniref:Uncharacterized protein n=1 Tax=Streptomyces natalensis ATCC 27448 TaxID=1240678 RepID=A0A0D7CW54_9ACTN|nr:hypothetical protein [Streptomyces natalensis]KIZ19617.1 hypothetical protein SNA_03735 [Streptomyces natalensis ATCC 27448]
MSVFIKLVENRPPKEYAEPAAADISYNDITEGESPATYEYDLLPSGALRILRVAKGEAAVVDSVYAPGLWFRAHGHWHGSAE